MGKSVVILGRGNVATSLDEALRHAGHTVLQMWHRGVPVAQGADFYIIAVSDNAIAEVLQQVPHCGIVLHTSGSTPLITDGVLYPMQTFTKGRALKWKEIPLFVEAKDETLLGQVLELARSLSDKVTVLDSERRRTLHMAAVWACNFPNHLWDICSGILQAEGIPFDVMLPLIDETVAKIHGMTPRQAQTGPARRGDTGTMERHAEMLSGENRQLYEQISGSISNTHNGSR